MKKIIKSFFRFFSKLVLACFLISLVLVFIFRWIPVPITPLMVIRVVENSFNTQRDVRLHKAWVPLKRISREIMLAVIAAEDQKFLDHSGFDWESIEEAMEEIKEGRRFRGGSTITNQTAKNVFLWPGRNFVRKGLEAYFTILLEFFWGKDRIMEVYLNVIEMGDGIYGIEAAAQAYYNKPAENLTKAEAAMIAAILPNPRRWNPNQPTSYLGERQAWIMRNMNNLGDLEIGK